VSEFAARHPVAQIAPVYALLLRVGAWCFPLTTLAHGPSTAALVGALFLGVAQGRSRLMASRTARSLLAGDDSLTIRAGSRAERVGWSSVLAVETWQRMNRVQYVAVHYRRDGRRRVATCWDQGGQADLLDFVRACAAGVSRGAPRGAIVVAGLRDPQVGLALLGRFLVDVAATASVGLADGLFTRALGLGLISAGVAALFEASRSPLTPLQLVSDQGVWWRSTARGRLRLDTIPCSLRDWVRALGDYEYQARRA